MKNSIVILCTLLVMLPGLALAQEDWAVIFAGSGTSDNDGDNTTFQATRVSDIFSPTALRSASDRGSVTRT